MDCLEFRRLLGSDPRVAGAAVRAHMESCAFCTEAFQRAQVFESRLTRAMQVPIPADLADRVLLAQLTGARQRQRTSRRRFAWVGLAAAACLVVAFGIVQQRQVRAEPLSELVAEHVTGPNEQNALALRTPLQNSAVRDAFADRGVQLTSVPEGIAYVHECPVGAYRTVHMVMPKNGEPVSVVYVTQHRAKGSTDFHRDGLNGREVPIADGTLVMLARNSDSFGALEHDWRDAIEGPAKIAAGSR